MVWGRVTGVTGKLKGGCFYSVVIIMQGERYSLVMKREKGIRKVVIKIHKLGIAGGLWYGKRCPFAW